MAGLTKDQSEELCRLGGIPKGHCGGFVRAVEGCLAGYRRLRERKTVLAVGTELAPIEICIRRALALLARKTWRPGEFHTIIRDISARLRNLSSDAREYLLFRGLTIGHDIASTWPDVNLNDRMSHVCRVYLRHLRETMRISPQKQHTSGNGQKSERYLPFRG